MKHGENRQRNLHGQEDGDDDDEHHCGGVGVPLPLGALPCEDTLPAVGLCLGLVDGEPAAPLLGSPHGGEEENVEDDQGDARNKLHKQATEPPGGGEGGQGGLKGRCIG